MRPEQPTLDQMRDKAIDAIRNAFAFDELRPIDETFRDRQANGTPCS